MFSEYKALLQVDKNYENVAVEGTLKYVHLGDETNSLKFFIHKDFSDLHIQCDQLKQFDFNLDGAPLWFLACSRPITLTMDQPVQKGETVSIDFKYNGCLEFGSFPIGVVSDRQIELGLYAPWYPIHESMKPCYFDVRMEAASNRMQLIGGSEFSSNGCVGQFKTLKPTLDCYMVGSTAFDKQCIVYNDEGFITEVFYVVEEDRQIAQFLADATKGIHQKLTSLYGESGQNKMTIVIMDRKDGGGYNRPGFVVLDREGINISSDEAIDKMQRFYYSYLAHEIAHLWWSKADVLTWEDWLNESFAEFSSYLMIESHYGKEIAAKKLESYRKAQAKMPPIRGIDRESEHAFSTLYGKGPAILHDWMEVVGRESFVKFIEKVHENQISCTNDLLELIAFELGEEMKKRAESDLDS